MIEPTTRIPWERIDIVQRLEELVRVIQESLTGTPQENTRTLEKLSRWTKRLVTIQDAVKRIESELRHHLEDTVGVSLGDGELLAIALFQPSTKNLFLELEAHYCRDGDPRIDCKILSSLVMMSEFAKSLALVGDAAISLAILDYLWSPDVIEVGKLTQKRAELVSNENLAALCDMWRLYENRIHFDPPVAKKSEIDHDKGTLVEAIYGIIYILHGLKAVRTAAKHLFDTSNRLERAL
ncbi:MAG: ribonuclease III domain-containing protein [Candidatus Thorarchaeota archaeon]|nr:ribonuclease III domain-containing protein [Candidatus Thorarchaeota archaeon]